MDITSYILGRKSSGGGGNLKYVVVDTLPSTGEDNTIYLVPKSSSKTNNYYDEYMYISNAWELIGDTQVDLSNYQPLIDSSNKLSSDLVDDTGATNKFFSGSYNDLSNKPTIPDELADLSDDSTHRLVTDTEKTTWNNKSDFSGSYNDLTNKPTIPDDSELLHYKGHVATSGDLPSLGQTSGSLVSPALSVTDVDAFSEKWLNPFKCSQDRINALLNDTTMSNKRLGYTNYILGATCTTQDGSEIKGNRLVIAYNNPSQVKIQMLYDTSEWAGTYLFSINASQDNPVYVYTTPATESQSYSDKLKHWTSASYDDSVLDTVITSPMILQGGLTSRDGRKRCFYFSNLVKYSENVADVLNLTINDLNGLSSSYKSNAYKSIQFTADNYIWNNDMIFLLPTTANVVNVQENTTTTKVNDVYTVGSNYAIYRRNENVQWEVWGQSGE